MWTRNRAGGRMRWLAVAVAVLVAVSLAQPASATASRGYVDGFGPDYRSDLIDEATLSNGGAYWRSNYAALWQMILWADGFLTPAQVDCRFGPQTEAATRAWQARLGVPQTGRFDDASQTAAGRWLRSAGDAAGEYYYYLGSAEDGAGQFRRFQIHRWPPSTTNTSGRWDVNYFGDWRGTWYTVMNLGRC
jgi:peptidoglycan hydrolase-like protein with peptidoglycan-binding domain